MTVDLVDGRQGPCNRETPYRPTWEATDRARLPRSLMPFRSIWRLLRFWDSQQSGELSHWPRRCRTD